jgi:siroheme synthase
VVTTLRNLASAVVTAQLGSPAVLVIGEVVRHARAAIAWEHAA